MRKDKSNKGKRKSKKNIANYNGTTILVVGLVAVLVAILTLGIISSNNAVKTAQSEIGKIEEAQLLESQRISNMSVYDRLSEGIESNVLIAGDSVAAGVRNDGSVYQWYNNIVTSIRNTYNVHVPFTKIFSEESGMYKGFYEFTQKSTNNYDIAILYFGGSDKENMPLVKFNNLYENMIRKLKSGNSKGDIFVIIPTTLDGDTDYSSAVRKIAKHYGLNIIETSEVFSNSGIAQEELFTLDGLYPSDTGYNLLANVITSIIDKNIKEGKAIDTVVNEQLNSDLDKYTKYKLKASFEKNDGFVGGASGFTTNKKEGNIIYKVKADTIGLSYSSSVNGGIMSIYIDNVHYKDINTYSEFTKNRLELIGEDITDGEHTITIINRSGPEYQIKVYGVVSNSVEN